MKFPSFYHKWVGIELTSDQKRLYLERKHGFYMVDSWNESWFMATFLYAMYLAYDHENGVYRQVLFAYPKSLEGRVTETIQSILKRLNVRLGLTSDIPTRNRLRKQVLTTMNHINLGSRVFGTKEAPSYWVAFGFAPGTVIPQWLQEGLL